MSSFLNENHGGSLTLTLLNVLGVLHVLNMPMDASLACWALFVDFCPILVHRPNLINIEKKTEAENICYWSVLVGHFGHLKNSRNYFKLILRFLLPNINLYKKSYPSWIKNIEVQDLYAS